MYVLSSYVLDDHSPHFFLYGVAFPQVISLNNSLSFFLRESSGFDENKYPKTNLHAYYFPARGLKSRKHTVTKSSFADLSVVSMYVMWGLGGLSFS